MAGFAFCYFLAFCSSQSSIKYLTYFRFYSGYQVQSSIEQSFHLTRYILPLAVFLFPTIFYTVQRSDIKHAQSRAFDLYMQLFINICNRTIPCFYFKNVLLLSVCSVFIRKQPYSQTIQGLKELINYNYRKMMCTMGARNTRGFTASVQTGNLPQPTHLTYQGVFNELKFDVGLKTQKIVDLHFGYARYQFQKSQFDSKINDYLAIFMKSSKDGADRDETPINAVISLDTSGSMGGELGENRKNNLSRLKLSVQAIKMFISKLRPNDSVGIITFTTDGKVLLEPTYKDKLPQNLFSLLDEVRADGGTTIRSGFDLSKKLLHNFLKQNECVHCQNRVIMLTDVEDSSFKYQKEIIDKASVQQGINLTVVGISTDFQSDVCQKLKNVKGFNYFCAVNEDDIKKYVFQTFDFGFFPSAYDISISISSEDLRKFEVFGAPDSDLVAGYNNNFKEASTHFTVSKMKSAFPSELQIHKDIVYTIGGLVLVKLERTSQNPFFKGEVTLNYSTAKGVFNEQKYLLNYQFHPKEQFFSDQCLKCALEGYMFTSEIRLMLQESNKMSKKKISERFEPYLSELELIVPKSKLDDFKNIKKIIKEYKQEAKRGKQGFFSKLLGFKK